MNSPTGETPLIAPQLEVQKRRTFAIISHPDAGKTTLTEKLLLYSGMVRTAGMVRARKGQKTASSDWMAMEQERGISITASAMQFRYKDAVINLLDTPGHQDFSEDTYRTLTAADSAVMVIDAGKGVEAQTRKLFAVCRMRGIPILTFINKLDLDSKDPFELIHEVEQVLGIQAAPLFWPVGSGKSFAGVIDLSTEKVNLFQRSQQGGAQKAEMREVPLATLADEPGVDRDAALKAMEELELVREAGNPFNREQFLRGELTPVFYGSALTNFGVEPFFDRFVSLAPTPGDTTVLLPSGEKRVLEACGEPFGAFVFKIQANMNPRHRDSMAYMRLCSGVFERDMVVKHHRSGKDVRLSHSYTVMAQDRSTVNVAYPGDIIGCINPGVFAIGDTVSLKGGYNFPPLPQFPPEVIAQIRPNDVLKKKAFDKGVAQLCAEGAIQLLRSFENVESVPYVAAVGKLQFEVLQYRLRDEYGVETSLDVLPYRYSAWLNGDAKKVKKPRGAFLTLDSRDRVVVLFSSEWEKNYLLEENPGYSLVEFAQ